MTVRSNQWENVAGTAIIAFTKGNDWNIYNNVFFTTNNSYTTTDGLICVMNGHGYVNNNIKIFSNTFVNVMSRASIHFDAGEGNEVYNNLFYGTRGIAMQNSAMTHDNNWCFDSDGGSDCNSVRSEPGGVVGMGDPFVNLAANDFRLKEPLANGRALPSAFNRDIRGVSRGTSGGWNVGAFEFGGAPINDGTNEPHVSNDDVIVVERARFNPAHGETVSFRAPTLQRAQVLTRSSQLVVSLAAQPDGHTFSIVWDGKNQSGALVASGIYLVKLQLDDPNALKKVVVIK